MNPGKPYSENLRANCFHKQNLRGQSSLWFSLWEHCFRIVPHLTTMDWSGEQRFAKVPHGKTMALRGETVFLKVSLKEHIFSQGPPCGNRNRKKAANFLITIDKKAASFFMW